MQKSVLHGVKIPHSGGRTFLIMAGLHVFDASIADVAAGQTVFLNEAESRHLVKSLRARPGEAVEILNGRGAVFCGTLETTDARAAGVRITAVRRAVAPATRLIWAPALLKGKAVEDMLRDVITLGLSRLIPLKTARCEVHLDEERAHTRRERWTTAAIEACKQSGNPWLPVIDEPQRFAAMCALLEAETHKGPVWKFIGSLEDDARPLGVVIRALRETSGKPAAMALAVGPEGDFTPEEYAQARAAGFLPVRLPGYIFRAGPAAMVGLSLMAGIQ